ncbi:vegetative incompatibility protein HET-E-1 [Rhizoctonia solani 123E]|uniref:Vegetative incompatibility protein HET-E-1 n=1 Tax=Rhizoctonia solani 123E TaxID=1423351 RepID=A0A074RGJ3_9AGAM|nr:vegetative incompatibility protein HET-E-1 [Rhizoctonia solani 123E]
MPLRGSLSKWKKRLLGSANPTSSSFDLPGTSTNTHAGSVQTLVSTTDALNSSIPANTNNEPIVATTTGVDHSPPAADAASSVAKSLLELLESSTNAFGPLKSAMGGLVQCIDIYERTAQGRKDYEELLKGLQELLDDLQKCMPGSMGMEMTNSVKRVCIELAAEVEKVERKLKGRTIKQLTEAMNASEEIPECYRRVQNRLQRLTLNATIAALKGLSEQGESINQQTAAFQRQTEVLKKQEMDARMKEMLPTKAAIYNSAESNDIQRGGCTPGTRQPQIELILEWAHNSESAKTYWMNGMAGTGKTTIAYSVCDALDASFGLGASFFCSRSIKECRQVKHIIPTIAYQLARFSLPFRCALDKVLESDSDTPARALNVQYQKLIVEPLLRVQGSLPTDFIVVIDALDECENENSLTQVLDLILTPGVALPIRFLLSSRPEPGIFLRMMDRLGEKDKMQLVLHDLDADVVGMDIETYLRRELQDVPLTDEQWSGLMERCGVFFIYASTTIRFIRQGYEMDTLDEAVGTITGSASVHKGRGDETAIDELYSTILLAAYSRPGMSDANRDRMRNILETVICAQELITLDSLAHLLTLKSADQANRLLLPLRSVLNVELTTGLVTTLHASFPDFMCSFDRSGVFYCAQSKRHGALARACLDVIHTVEPKFNICGLASSYLLDNEVEQLAERVEQAISPGLNYACRYWSTHLYLGDSPDEMLVNIQRFFSERLLIWMEILNLTGGMRFGTMIIRQAERLCSERPALSNLVKIARDAAQFVSIFAANPVCQSTPHIYVSMLAFWPQSRPVSKAYEKTRGALKPKGSSIDWRQLALIATWKVSNDQVCSISLSTDGTRIAAATNNCIDLLDVFTGDQVLHVKDRSMRGVQAVAMSPDGTRIAFGGIHHVCLLDVQNEAIQQVYQPESMVLSVTFSPDGSHFAFGLSDGDIHIYSSQECGPVCGPLNGHTRWVRSVAFSPDGLFLASGSDDFSIRVWDAGSGQMIGKPLQGHSHRVMAVSYSPDGTRLASVALDKNVRVWDPLAEQTVLLTEHSERSRSVTFSPDGTFIASGLANKTIRVYDAKTGQILFSPLEGHTDSVNSVIVSPDSTQLFSCSDDGTIRLWSVQDLDAPNSSQPTFPDGIRSVRYSPDSSRVVSGSYNGSICVWDVQTGEMVLGPLRSHSGAITTVDYSPNNAYIASASGDSTLQIWSAHDGRDLYGAMHGHTDTVNCVRFSPDGLLLVSGSDDATVRLWDVSSERSVIRPLRGHSGPVSSVAFSPNGALVASSSSDFTIRVWDIKTGQNMIGPLQGHKDRVNSVEFSPDGSKLLTGSSDKFKRTWDAQTGQALLVWGNDQSKINAASFSPDGLLVVSCSDDPATQIWDAQTGELMLTLEGHTDRVQSVQFSPDGLHIATCSHDGAIRFWDVSSRLACAQLNRLKGADISLLQSKR